MNIRFSGFGGQGIIVSAIIFGKAAVYDRKKAIQTQSYGSESRGGACKSDVIISEEEIYEIEPTEVDILVAMSQTAYEKYIGNLKDKGILFLEKDLVQLGVPSTSEGLTSTSTHSSGKKTFICHSISATDIAFKATGINIMANMLMLGFITPILNYINKDAIKKAIREHVPPGTIDKNFDLFEKGYELGLKAADLAEKQS
jgi:2-oxoglutarate ferredoxin oxidoreductase subunit gamma